MSIDNECPKPPKGTEIAQTRDQICTQHAYKPDSNCPLEFVFEVLSPFSRGQNFHKSIFALKWKKVPPLELSPMTF